MEVREIGDGKYELFMDDPIEPMDWAGAIIEPVDSQYGWTLYWGYTDGEGEKHSFKLPGLVYPDPLADTVEECIEKVKSAFDNPAQPLAVSVMEARARKRGNSDK